jgi:hypothetical protein
MSLMTRKDKARSRASAGLGRARKAATRVTPLAKSAGTTAAQGVQGAREWAAPRIGHGVEGARTWAAPRIEQAAHSLQENVAPKVSGMLEAAAHRIEPAAAATKRRLWPRLMAGIALVTAAAGAVAAVAARRRGAKQPDDVMTGDDAEDTKPESAEDADSDTVMAEAGGSNGKGARR